MLVPRILFAAAALSLAASAASACEGQSGKVIFEDKFTDDMGGWTFGAGDGFVLKNPGATLSVPAAEGSQSRSVQNQTFTASEGDYCAEMSFPENAVALNGAMGVVMLGPDYENNWIVEAIADGKVGLYKRINRKWTTVWEVDGNGAVKTDPASKNSVRAIVKGNTITVIVNGQTIKSVRAAIPGGELKFGPIAEYTKGSATPVDYTVHSFSVFPAK